MKSITSYHRHLHYSCDNTKRSLNVMLVYILLNLKSFVLKMNNLSHASYFIVIMKMTMKFTIPGHACVLQYLPSTDTPLQVLPPLLGFGLEHDLDLVCFPVAHDLEQDAQAPQDVHAPFTEKKKPRCILGIGGEYYALII
jgi:hypothetical protein